MYLQSSATTSQSWRHHLSLDWFDVAIKHVTNNTKWRNSWTWQISWFKSRTHLWHCWTSGQPARSTLYLAFMISCWYFNVIMTSPHKLMLEANFRHGLHKKFWRAYSHFKQIVASTTCRWRSHKQSDSQVWRFGFLPLRNFTCVLKKLSFFLNLWSFCVEKN